MRVTNLSFTDRIIARTIGRGRLFADGWGVEAWIERALTERRIVAKPMPIKVNLRSERSQSGITTRDLYFVSPVSELPYEAKLVHGRWLLPKQGSPNIVYLSFPATGDDSYAPRTRFWRPLVQEGASVILLQYPLYGDRKPRLQSGTWLRTVSDQVLLQFAITQEAVCLLGWLEEQGFSRLGVSGFSQGGSVAAVVASLFEKSLAVASFATGVTPAPVFTQGQLATKIDFGALKDESRQRLNAVFEAGNLGRYPRVARPEACVIVAGRRDAYVFPRYVEALAALWPGCEVRWHNSGHVNLWVTRGNALRDAVRDASRRL